MAVKKTSETTPRKKGATKIEEKEKVKKTPVIEKRELLKIAEEKEAPTEEVAIPAPLEEEAEKTVEEEIEAVKESKEKRDVQASRKSRLVSLLLCFFLGWAGGHRFYVKKMGTALIMLFTMGGFGIWYFIDFIMIASGAFKDRDNLSLKRWI